MYEDSFRITVTLERGGFVEDGPWTPDLIAPVYAAQLCERKHAHHAFKVLEDLIVKEMDK